MITQLSALIVQFQAGVKAMRSLIKIPVNFKALEMEQEGRESDLEKSLNCIIDALTWQTGST